MTKTEIFRKAWTEARTAALRFGGKASEYFAACLRQVYAFLTDPVGKLVALGGKEWKKAEIGKHRVYFDDANRFAGLVRDYRGQWSYDDRTISNYRAKELVLSGFYFDALSRTFHHSAGRWNGEVFDAAVAEIKRLTGL